MPAGVPGEAADGLSLAVAQFDDESPVSLEQRVEFREEPAIEQEAVGSGTQRWVWVVIPDFRLESGNLRFRYVRRITYHEIGLWRKWEAEKRPGEVSEEEGDAALELVEAQVFRGELEGMGGEV